MAYSENNIGASGLDPRRGEYAAEETHTPRILVQDEESLGQASASGTGAVQPSHTSEPRSFPIFVIPQGGVVRQGGPDEGSSASVGVEVTGSLPLFGYPELDMSALQGGSEHTGILKQAPAPTSGTPVHNVAVQATEQNPSESAAFTIGSVECGENPRTIYNNEATHEQPGPASDQEDLAAKGQSSGHVNDENMASVVRLLQDAIPRLTNTLHQQPSVTDSSSHPLRAGLSNSFTPGFISPTIPLSPRGRATAPCSPVLIVGHHIPNVPIITIEPSMTPGGSPRVWHNGSCFIFPSAEEKTPLLGSPVRSNLTSSSAQTTQTCYPGSIEPPLQSRYFRFSREQLMILISMLLVDFSSFASMSIMAPFFPEQMTKRGLSTTLDGAIFSIYALVIFVASPIVGKLLPLMNTKAVYLAGIGIAGVGNIFFGMVVYVEHPMLFAVLSIILRVLVAFGSACFLTVIYTLVPILFPDDMNTVNGMLETAVGVGMCVGPAVGVWLYTLGGFSLPFYGLGGFILVTVPINMMTFPERGETSEKLKGSYEVDAASEARPTGIAKVLCRAGVILPLAILCVTAVCLAILYPTLQPHMDNLGVSVEGVGLVFLMMSAVYALCSPLVGLATDRYNCPSSFMFAGLLLLTLALNLLGNSPLLPHVNRDMLYIQDVVAIMMIGLASAMSIVPTFASIIHDLGEDGTVDIAVFSVVGGLWSSSYSLGEMLGPVYAGLMAEYMSFGASTTVTALVPGILALVQGVYMCVKCYQSHSVPAVIKTTH